MKNAMKKLMSLVLVAIMLVSALPFAAFADGEAAPTTAVVVIVEKQADGNDLESRYEQIPVAAAGISVANAVAATGYDMTDKEITNGKHYPGGSNGVDITSATVVKPGDSLRVRVAVKETPDPVPTPVVKETCNICGKTYDQGASHVCIVKKTCDTCGMSYSYAEDQADPHVCATPIKIVVKVDSSDNKVWEGTKIPSNGTDATVGNLLTYCWSKTWSNTYKFKHAYAYRVDGTKGYVETLDGKINAGDEVHILVTKKTVDYVEGTGTTPTNKFPYDIYLNIYINNKFDVPAKTLKISENIAKDGKVSLGEASDVVYKYYHATNTSKPVGIDGLYKGEGNWALNFVTDSGKADAFTNLDSAREENYVFINIMATNVTPYNLNSTTSATADSSNPKTGDAIFAPIFVLGLSASALAVMFYLNKKRAV